MKNTNSSDTDKNREEVKDFYSKLAFEAMERAQTDDELWAAIERFHHPIG